MKMIYDIVTIGLGPAGMAVSIMGSEMGLKVCAIEADRIGGECMNSGCIPSKSLLRMASARHLFSRLPNMELESSDLPGVLDPFSRIKGYVDFIREKKTMGMFRKTDLILGQGRARFVGPDTVAVGDRVIRGRRIFICVGTKPFIPPIPGIDQVQVITNENLFELKGIPDSMTILGGGAIGCEMAQAFSRMGCKCTLLHMDSHLLPGGDAEAGELLQQTMEREGIRVFNSTKLSRVEKRGDSVAAFTENGEEIVSERILVAAGRKHDYSSLDLSSAGISWETGPIRVDQFLRTSNKKVLAVGDCNGHRLFSHAAMHQGMIGLIGCMVPWPLKHIPWPFSLKFRNYPVPWTVFTTPAVSVVGRTESELRKQGISYEVVRCEYGDYGAAIAEDVATGFIKAFVTGTGKILGVVIVGEGSGEMINEWALAIQKGMRMLDIMFLQHSFPTMGFLTKRVSETWMMGKMESGFLKSMCRLFFRF
ncbi:MAG: pyridine nucleotide-disulfide oxidoreductase [Candidatus Wallbacteria bacterium HGW-Wallbacteria-1]|uniref:Pyridine nucleotide-disulfide oxidoreductase n=1 Tax=Candidatus Wallbacteria bacterium HGW-Wallbacteria-1 TaxID=2013854 RepID=A0A2N1PTC3_9BACT|nr:MAG: pyridine nucleotide-disulfide oxidoreductase [Candidatus Wallbacteria bacterium HGW-Wallbacteria-1]